MPIEGTVPYICSEMSWAPRSAVLVDKLVDELCLWMSYAGRRSCVVDMLGGELSP